MLSAGAGIGERTKMDVVDIAILQVGGNTAPISLLAEGLSHSPVPING